MNQSMIATIATINEWHCDRPGCSVPAGLVYATAGHTINGTRVLEVDTVRCLHHGILPKVEEPHQEARTEPQVETPTPTPETVLAASETPRKHSPIVDPASLFKAKDFDVAYPRWQRDEDGKWTAPPQTREPQGETVETFAPPPSRRVSEAGDFVRLPLENHTIWHAVRRSGTVLDLWPETEPTQPNVPALETWCNAGALKAHTYSWKAQTFGMEPSIPEEMCGDCTLAMETAIRD